MVVAVRDEAKGQRQASQDQRPAVQVEQRPSLREPDVRHPVVEVGAVRPVHGPAVLETLGDHEAAVEDRDGEHDQREEESDHGVCLQSAQDRRRREQIPQQVRARVPHEGRRRREAVA